MEFDFKDNDNGFWEAKCQACNIFTRVNDLNLCSECAAKLDRDMIRQRDWDYASIAFGVPPEKREELRAIIIRKHGECFELICPENSERMTNKSRKRKSTRKGGCGGC